LGERLTGRQLVSRGTLLVSGSVPTLEQEEVGTMKFSEIVKQAVTLLQESQRITYRALKLEFDLNEEQLVALKEELIKAVQVARDENGEVLVWADSPESRVQSLESKTGNLSDPRRQTLDPRP
jgi:hypothetical protein